MSNWLPVLVASLIAATAAILANFLKEVWDEQGRRRERRRQAYLRLAAASEVIAMRSAVFNSTRTPRSAFGESLGDMRKFVLALGLIGLARRRLNSESLQLLVSAVPTPQGSGLPVSQSALVEAMDDLIRARVEVSLFGTPEAIAAASELLDCSRAFLSAVETAAQFSWPIRWSLKHAGDIERDAMLQAHERFVDVTRAEL